MSNFISVFNKGKEGKNLGLTTGIPELDVAINGLQKKTSIGLVAAPKVGKTTLADFAFVIQPYLQALTLGTLNNLQWIYFSFEIDRIGKEFKYASYFMAYDFQQFSIIFEDKIYEMCADYLMGRLVHKYIDNGVAKTKIVPITPEHEEMLKIVYRNRIVPIFGRFNELGQKIEEGKIRFVGEADNPTGMYKYLLAYANKKGTWVTETYKVLSEDKEEYKSRKIGWNSHNPELHTIIITDHIRKVRRERGFSLKEAIDKWLEYSTELRNLCWFTFINICHSNRGLSNVDRLKFQGEFVFPSTDDTKDTGNLGEESNILMSLFNPADEKYNIKKHFGKVLKEYPYYRSLHITESRDTFCPQHLQLNMFGGINTFESIDKTF